MNNHRLMTGRGIGAVDGDGVGAIIPRAIFARKTALNNQVKNVWGYERLIRIEPLQKGLRGTLWGSSLLGHSQRMDAAWK